MHYYRSAGTIYYATSRPCDHHVVFYTEIIVQCLLSTMLSINSNLSEHFRTRRIGNVVFLKMTGERQQQVSALWRVQPVIKRIDTVINLKMLI